MHLTRASGGTSPASYGGSFLRGLLMGGADSVPGISGGTIALVVGVYEGLLASIGNGFRAILSLLRLDVAGAAGHLRDVEWRLMVPLVAGIGSAFALAARFIPRLLATYPAEMRGLFLGMVAASISIPWRRIQRPDRRLWLVVAVTAVVAFVFTGLPQLASTDDPSLLRVLVSAAVAICAMILPGVSGAFLLQVLGIYESTLRAVNDGDLLYVLVFAVGVVAGLGSFSLLLTALLRRYHDLTMAALVGLMIGSLRALWPWQDGSRSLEMPAQADAAVLVVAMVAAGFGIVTLIERWGRTRIAASEAARSSSDPL